MPSSNDHNACIEQPLMADRTEARLSPTAEAFVPSEVSTAAHKPILAERFKTKMCRNYETTGVCPYEARCMFAHGDAELRTKQMNLDDNLVTEDAIKAFQRSLFALRHPPVYSSYGGTNDFQGHQHHHPHHRDGGWSNAAMSPVGRKDHFDYIAAGSSSSSSAGDSPSHPQPVKRTLPYRHDPYAERSAWTPFRQHVVLP